jgi:hypothetical protein
MGYYPPTYNRAKYFSDNNIPYGKVHLGFLNFDNDSNFLAEAKTEPNIAGRDFENKPSPPTSSSQNVYYYTPLYNQWRYFINNTNLSLSDRQQAFQKVPGLSGNALKLISTESSANDIPNTTPIVDFNSVIDWSWNPDILGTEFDIQTPSHDSIIFQFGLFSYEYQAESLNDFYNNTSKYYGNLGAVTIYFKDNKYYCAISRYHKQYTTSAIETMTQSVVSRISDSIETVDTWNHISLLNYSGSTYILFNDTLILQYAPPTYWSDYAEVGFNKNEVFSLSNHQNIICDRIVINMDGTETPQNEQSTLDNANFYPIMLWGSGHFRNTFKYAKNASKTKTNITGTISVSDPSENTYLTNMIQYVKDPLPAGDLTLSFDFNPGDSLVYDNIEVFKNIYLNITEKNLPGIINIETKQYSNSDLQGQINIVKSKDLNGQLVIKQEYQYYLFLSITVPQPEIDLPGQLEIQYKTSKDINTYLTVPQPVIDLPGSLIIKKDYNKDLFNINVRVPVSVKPETYGPIDGDLIIKIPFPYTQFTDMEFILTETKNNLFIPQRYYERYDEYHLLLSKDLGLKENDEIRFTFCHNDGKFHVQKIEFYFKSMGNASYYFLNMITPYRVNIEDTNTKFLVFVNRKQIVNNKDYYIDNEEGVLVFLNDQLANSANDRIDLVCFFTGIDDTATADLPMSGYIYLKRNMIDRNYNNNMMATFINGQLIPRDKILHISNNIYKVKEDIQSRHDLQVLNMSNRINSLVPFYKQCKEYPFFSSTLLYNGKIIDNFNPRYIECSFPVEVKVPALTTYGRQHMTIYQNPVYFDPKFLLECKNYYISFIHKSTQSESLKYTLDFYPDDTSSTPEEMYVKLELHIKTPFEEELEESRTNILFVTLPATITEINEDYCYASLQIKQIINLDIWNNRFLDMCDGIILRIEPGKTFMNDPSQVYFNLWSNGFEDFEKEQITIFEYRISDSYDGKGNIKYSKYLTFNPEESVKNAIKLANDNLK